MKQHATFGTFLEAACFAYFGLVTRGQPVSRLFKAGDTWFVCWSTPD